MDRRDVRFVSYIEKKVRDTIRTYSLCSKDSRIAVAVSGGKDSLACLFILHTLGYDVEAMTIDPGIGEYAKKNLSNLKTFCTTYDIPLHILSYTELIGYPLPELMERLHTDGKKRYSPCMICGILKRYYLNRYARENGFTHIATGHNLDDEAQGFMMSVFRNDIDRALRQGPITGTRNAAGFVTRIKPLYKISEAEVIRYTKIRRFTIEYGSCPLSEGAYRKEYREMLDRFVESYPHTKYNISSFQEAFKEKVLSTGAKKEADVPINRCEQCGEPTAQSICRVCALLKDLSLSD
jgi:uncharacterized protein (TIGR00269 family)